MKIVTVEQMRAIEREASERYGLNSATLMENAGQSVAERIRAHLSGDVAGVQMLVLVGPGNNGGDGQVAARHLANWGAAVFQYIWRDRRLIRPSETADAQSGAIEQLPSDVLRGADVVLDALLGTGHGRPLDPSMRQLLAAVEAEQARRPALLTVALDLPSGLNADTGAVDDGTVRADLTVTLAFPKVGLLLFPGADYIGELEVGSIGLPADMGGDIPFDLLDTHLVRQKLPARPLDSNKGTFGKAMVLAGSPPFPGSAFLASTAASRTGAGLVTLATTPDMAPIYAVKLSEATFTILPRPEASPDERAAALVGALDGYAALLVGPGLGQSDATALFLQAVFTALRELPDARRPHMVVDADGLNMLAHLARWWELLPSQTVLTPHPGEMSRLLGGTPVSGGHADRLKIVSQAAARWGHVVVLKGACTLIAHPDGRIAANWPPNPALATAGTGDVLAGMVAGFLAQHLDPFDGACVAVFGHARAGLAVSQRLGNAGLLASDLLSEIPVALQTIRGA